jgi:hypothetical protein
MKFFNWIPDTTLNTSHCGKANRDWILEISNFAEYPGLQIGVAFLYCPKHNKYIQVNETQAGQVLG